MRKTVNPTPLGMALVLVVMVMVIVTGASEVTLPVYTPNISLTDVPVGIFDRKVTLVPRIPKPILVVNHDVQNANLITIDDDGLESVRFFEVYRRRLADEFGADVWSRWRLNAVVGKTIYGTYVSVDELVKTANLYEYKARAVDINGNQVGAWTDVLQRRVPGEGTGSGR